MKILLILFLGSAIVLWISTFGYMLVLGLMALKRRHSTPEIKDCPPIAIVVPVLNEESLILAKLQDLNLCRRQGRPDQLCLAEVAPGHHLKAVSTKGKA
jgi:hypothetical protein